MPGVIDYDKLADMLAERVSKTPRNAKAIWGPNEAANYLKLARRQFVDRVSKHHSFPASINLPTICGRRCYPRWYADDVIKWAAKQQG